MGRPRRVVVVGAGHNGLIAAIRLAERGFPVTVLEAGREPGGGVSSDERTLPGFLHDSCSGFFPLTVASPAFRELELERHGVEWIDPDVPMAHVLDGGSIALHRDLERTVESLDACATGAGRAWRGLIELVWPRRRELVEAALSRFPPVRPAAALAAGLRGDTIRFARMMAGSVAGLGRRLFDDDRAAAWLAGSALHSDLSPHATGSGAMGFGLNFLGHLVGWPFPRGGAGKLTSALVTLLARHDGELRCEAPVERIELRGGRVAAVRLRSGEIIDADAVVATVSAAPLAAMLPAGALSERLSRRLRTWRYGLGTFKLDYALSAPVPWSSEIARQAAVVHAGGQLDELAHAHGRSSAGQVPQRPTLVLGQHSLHDPTRAPDGQHTLYAYSRLPQRPDMSDAEVAERVAAQIERFAPGFRDTILARATRSPTDLERDNPSLVGGDLAAGSMAADQQLVFRPAPRLVRYRTPVPGLYVGSASVHPGPGVHGVCGRGAADALLEDASPLRFWRRFGS